MARVGAAGIDRDRAALMALTPSRVPIRLRVTLVFAVVLALVLAGAGLFVDLRLRAELNQTIDHALRARAGDVIALVSQADSGLRQSPGTLVRRGQEFAQILDGRGAIFDATPETGRRPLLSPSELSAALKRSAFFERQALAGVDGRARLLAVPVRAQGQRLVVIVGSSLHDSDTAVARLQSLLLLGGAGALLLAGLAGYGAVAGALRPIESMRRRAEHISAASSEQRLPVSPARDEVARLGNTLNAMLGRLEEAFARERAFVADASHELRTPLSIIKAELEVALRTPKDHAALEHAIRSSAEETDRLTRLTEDLLVIARSDQGLLPVRRSRENAVVLLIRTRERFARRANESRREVLIACSDSLELEVDPSQIEQALGNLLDNALRHGTGTITLSAALTPTGAELHVSDLGPGFPAAFLSEAFERFTRAEVSRTTIGSGLGLAIVAAIAVAHGGRAQADNGPDGGADVWIALPLRG